MLKSFVLVPVLLLVLASAACSSSGGSEESAAPATTGSAGPAESSVESDDAPAGCAAHADCGEGRFCSKPPGDCDGDTGECVEKPQFCTRDFRPVCGCDGRTYGNGCEAASAGQNVDYTGECRKTRKTRKTDPG